MNGCVIANTPIAVDFWKVRECPQAKLFFLTHLHGDHIIGLTSSWHYPIYCSEITGRLLKHKYELKEEFIKVLEVRSPSIVYLDREGKEQMTVTPLDANHCPGAIMFLFEGYFGRILHTGDFRFTPQMLDYPPLSSLSGRIDTIYLDNTYCSPGCVFPDRETATDMIIDIIQSHPDHDVVIGMRNLGKEDMLCKIAMKFRTWISVPSATFKTLEILEVQDVFRNSCPDCRITVVPFHKISNKLIHNLNEEFPTIAILPTALYCGIDAEPYINQENVFVVPYSDHSSYTELQEFVAGLRPSSIIPIVKSRSRGPFGVSIADRADMSCFTKYLSGNEKRDVCVPASVKSFMNNHRIHPVTSGKPSNIRKRKSLTKVIKSNKQRGVTYEAPTEEFTSSKMMLLNTALCDPFKNDDICADFTGSVETSDTNKEMIQIDLTKDKNSFKVVENNVENITNTAKKRKGTLGAIDFVEMKGSVEYGESEATSASVTQKENMDPGKTPLSTCVPEDCPMSEFTINKQLQSENGGNSDLYLLESQGFEVGGENPESSCNRTSEFTAESSVHELTGHAEDDLISVTNVHTANCEVFNEKDAECFDICDEVRDNYVGTLCSLSVSQISKQSSVIQREREKSNKNILQKAKKSSKNSSSKDNLTKFMESSKRHTSNEDIVTKVSMNLESQSPIDGIVTEVSNSPRCKDIPVAKITPCPKQHTSEKRRVPEVTEKRNKHVNEDCELNRKPNKHVNEDCELSRKPNKHVNEDCELTGPNSNATFTELDLIECYFVPASARTKSVRRRKLYRNFHEGMNKMFQTH